MKTCDSDNFVQVLVGNEDCQRQTFANFVQNGTSVDCGEITVMTRRQAKAKKHVRFDNEPSLQPPEAAKHGGEPGEVANEGSFSELASHHPSNTVLSAVPDAEDVEPVEVQRERWKRIAKAQDEELKWSNLKVVLKGHAEKLSYKDARDAWIYADRFVLSEYGVLHYLGLNRRYDKGWQEETKLRLVVPTTMIQEVLQNCHDSLEGGH